MIDNLTRIFEASFIRAPWGWTGLVLGILAYFKIKPKLQELANAREINLLEKRGEDMKEMRARMEKLESSLAVKEGELTLFRHRLNNVTQCLDALIMLIKAAPDQAAKHIELIEAMREEQRKEESLEKGAAIGARVALKTAT